MTEIGAMIALRAALVQALTGYGYTASVLAGRQPTKQLLQDNAVYIFPIGETRQGVQGRTYTRARASDTGDMGHVERVRVSKTMQVQAFRKHDINDPQDYTASDLCAVVKMVIESLPFQEAIRAAGIAVHNATPLREPEFLNDAGDYEKNPSFDFDLSFTREIKPTTMPITDITAETFGI